MLTILIVDDDRSYLCMLKAALEFAGMSVRLAENAEEALNVLKKTNPDLILTDLKMPGMDGIELSTRIKGIAPDLPIIMLTGSLTPGLAESATGIGIKSVLDKLTSPKEIARIISEEAVKSGMIQNAFSVDPVHYQGAR